MTVADDRWLDVHEVAAELGLSYLAATGVIGTYVTSGFPEWHVLPGGKIRWRLSEVAGWRDTPREPQWQFGDEWPGPEVAAREAEPAETPRAVLGLVKLATEHGWLTSVTYARGTLPTAQGRPGRVVATVALRFKRPRLHERHEHPIKARGYGLWRQNADRWTYEGGALTGVSAGQRYYRVDKDKIERLILETTTFGINKLSATALRAVLSH